MTPDAIERLVSETMEIQFWSKMVRRDPDECWLWTGGLTDDGYGAFYYRTNDKTHRDVPDWWQPVPWLSDDRYAMRLFDALPQGFRAHIVEFYIGEQRRFQTALAWLTEKGVPIEAV